MTDDADPGLVRFWFEFSYERDSYGSRRGPIAAGVTAFDLEDAKDILRAEFFDPMHIDFPAVSKLIENVDVSAIRFPFRRIGGPNYLPPIWRGIWFPAPSSLSPLR